jgi:hypothetical protein
MSGGALVAAEAMVLIGAVVAFYVWQMRDLKKARLEREAREKAAGDGPPHG